MPQEEKNPGGHPGSNTNATNDSSALGILAAALVQAGYTVHNESGATVAYCPCGNDFIVGHNSRPYHLMMKWHDCEHHQPVLKATTTAVKAERVAQEPPHQEQRYMPGDPAAAGTAGPTGADKPETGRHLKVEQASNITMRATRWLWEEDKGTARWLPLGGFTLLGGREGVGKSTIAYGIAAKVTTGTLPGNYYDKPKSVIICATEDAWEQTVVPRLAAAGADLNRVFRVDAVTAEGWHESLSLPEDNARLKELCIKEEVALVLLDPLMGTINGKLDSHKDAEVRKALEPLSRLAHDCQLTILGLIHVNKSTGADLLTRLMASRAFSAVARSVLFAAREEEGDGTFTSGQETFLFGQPKNNLAAKVPHALRYQIEGVKVGHDDDLDLDVWNSRIRWVGKVNGSIQDIILDQETQKPGPGEGELATRIGAWIGEQGRAVTAAEIAAAFSDEKRNTVDRNLARMVKRGTLVRPIYGHYSLPPNPSVLSEEEEVS